MSIVTDNLLKRKGYTPYCGAVDCRINMPRTIFNGTQFGCPCGWVSDFPDRFIRSYKKKWKL